MRKDTRYVSRHFRIPDLSSRILAQAGLPRPAGGERCLLAARKRGEPRQKAGHQRPALHRDTAGNPTVRALFVGPRRGKGAILPRAGPPWPLRAKDPKPRGAEQHGRQAPVRPRQPGGPDGVRPELRDALPGDRLLRAGPSRRRPRGGGQKGARVRDRVRLGLKRQLPHASRALPRRGG